jgi:hypothetical protein
MTQRILPLVFAMTLMAGFAGCAVDDSATATSSAAATTVVCTPGAQTCDVGCFYQGGPSTDDCIIQCNAAGNGWMTLTDCGYAQEFPFSASCLNSQPQPICKYN